MARRKPAAGSAVPLWNVPIPIADIPETGRGLTVAADEPTRSAIAKAAGLTGLPRLEVSVELIRKGQGGIHVVGQVAATVEQACVVTLDPIASEIVEPIDLVFLPAGTITDAAAEVTLDQADQEPPEVLHDGKINIGAIAGEFLLLGIDPYPRKSGVEFDAPPAGDPAAHPFAALAALKKES